MLWFSGLAGEWEFALTASVSLALEEVVGGVLLVLGESMSLWDARGTC